MLDPVWVAHEHQHEDDFSGVRTELEGFFEAVDEQQVLVGDFVCESTHQGLHKIVFEAALILAKLHEISRVFAKQTDGRLDLSYFNCAGVAATVHEEPDDE